MNTPSSHQSDDSIPTESHQGPVPRQHLDFDPSTPARSVRTWLAVFGALGALSVGGAIAAFAILAFGSDSGFTLRGINADGSRDAHVNAPAASDEGAQGSGVSTTIEAGAQAPAAEGSAENVPATRAAPAAVAIAYEAGALSVGQASPPPAPAPAPPSTRSPSGSSNSGSSSRRSNPPPAQSGSRSGRQSPAPRPVPPPAPIDDDDDDDDDWDDDDD